MSDQPLGQLTTQTMTMPKDTNPAGDIFGGWVLSQMDIASGICAARRAQSRVVTVAMNGMSFILPVRVGDVLGVYTSIKSIGRSSMTIHAEAWVRRYKHGSHEKVTEGEFKFVALDEQGRPMPVPVESDQD